MLRAQWFLGAFVGLVLGFFVGASFYWGVYGTNIRQAAGSTIEQTMEKIDKAEADARKEKADEALARYTYWLTVLTGVVGAATVGLVIATALVYITGEKQLGVIGDLSKRQADDTRTLQRAYLTVLPRGVKPYRSTPDKLGCDVGIYNAGNLPARDVKWCIEIRLSHDPSEKDFPAENCRVYGNNIILPKSELIKGALGMDTDSLVQHIKGGTVNDRWLYVWGQVKYKDGFGEERAVSFCHRYNLIGITGNKLASEDGRMHEYGNSETPDA